MAKTILVVDDDPTVFPLIEGILKPAGFTLTSAVDGLDALVKIKNEKPDLVILDVMMPEINGYDVAYQLRFNNAFDDLPIILFTSRERELPEDISMKVNIDYMHKPVNKSELLKKVNHFLK